MSRLDDLVQFYALIDQLVELHVGGMRTLANLAEFRDWPDRGVYLFFEPSEVRSDTGTGPRVVRVGTHALRERSRSTLRQRLGQHRGSVSGGGNHRGSIFRSLIGQALLARGDLAPCTSWDVKRDAVKASEALGMSREALAIAEAPVERAVTHYIGAMPFLWLEIDDDPGCRSLRGEIERSAIALLSDYGRTQLDPPSPEWLGHFSNRSLVRESGIWNQHHVEATHDPAFLSLFEQMIAQMGRAR